MFDFQITLPKYLRTFLHKNAITTIGLTDQSDYSICLLIGQTFHPYSIKKAKKLRNVFIYKKPDTLQKARQFALCFIYKKHDTLHHAISHENVEFGIYIQEA